MLSFISHPTSPVKGKISLPGDKSISHRAIMLGAIAEGTTRINGFLEGEDCLSTIAAFRAMGVVISGPDSQHVLIKGVGKHGLQRPIDTIDCGNSGTTMRLLSGILAAQQFDSHLTGDASLLKRPMQRVSQPMMQMGAEIETNKGCPPLHIYGGRALKGVCYEMPEASAQVKSCLLLAGMYANGETTIIEPVVSRDHTERMFSAFSYPIARSNGQITIDSRHQCIGTDIDVPGDFSSAVFFIVAATIIPGSEIMLSNVGINPTRTGAIDILNQMGASIRIENERLYGEEPVADIHVSYAPLTGIEIPIHLVSLAIDEFPVLFIAAAAAKGKTILRGARELRYKESDRIGVMASGLQALLISAIPQEDGIVIQGGLINGGVVDSHGDHRVAMAFAIAGAVATSPVTIKNCHSVSTSFPNFVDTANKVQLMLTCVDSK